MRITEGQVHDSQVAEDLMDYTSGTAILADKAYDSNAIVQAAKDRHMVPVIPCNRTRAKKRRLNKELYKFRYRVECFFFELKRFRRVATRYEKLAKNYSAIVHFAALFSWLN